MEQRKPSAGRRPAAKAAVTRTGQLPLRRAVVKGLFNPGTERERGQMILMLALALTGLLVATGLAVDSGVLLMRKAQLDRAVDAAALAGVVEVKKDETLGLANTRGQQLMAANGVITTTAQACFGTTSAGDCQCPTFNMQPGQPTDYCGQPNQGSLPGSQRYYVRARWQSETYFMRLVGFDTIPLYSEAEAEYMPLVDIYASDLNGYGLVKLSTQSIFGPRQVTQFGDVYSSLYKRDATNTTNVPNDEWEDQYGVYTYRIHIPANFEDNYGRSVRVELFDPDTGNRWAGSNGFPIAGTTGLPSLIYGVDATAFTPGNCRTNDPSRINMWEDACLLETPYRASSPQPNPNRFWFMRIDEHRALFAANPTVVRGNPYSQATLMNNLTETVYRLYYMKQNPDGSVQEVDLAYYTGKRHTNETGQEGHSTDLMWVSPGAPPGERMPEIYVFQELMDLGTTYGVTAPGMPVNIVTGAPVPDYYSPAEPAIPTVACSTFRSSNPGWFPPNPSYANGAFSLANGCAPGDGNFIIDLDTEVPGIMVDNNSGTRDIYLQVRSINGSSENGFEIWAGPSLSADPEKWYAPADINARQLYLWNLQAFGSQNADFLGWRQSPVTVTGLGRLPMNGMTEGQVDIPLAYLGPEFTGEELLVKMFDPDSGAADPVIFYFDSIPETDWNYCYDDRDFSLATQWGLCRENAGGYNLLAYLHRGEAHVFRMCAGCPNVTDGQWNQSFRMNLPSEHDATNPVPFYGGRLLARYKPGLGDTYVWFIAIDSRPYLVR